ncbi:MAG: hypothetical protein P4M13_06060 [Alphaproteobacteria bacterium]|nr:hypothetical protein [Alphaproteobacteria bacterium]
MTKYLFSPRVLLPLAILLGVLVMGLRINDMRSVLSSGKLTLETAQAQDASSPSAAAPEKEAPPPAKAPDTPVEPALAASPPSADASPAELDVLKQLSDRRAQLDKRSGDLDTRASLLKITEQRIDQKIKEMETLRKQLQSMVDQVGGAQQAQLANLVKIYETMKPEDAARIFNTLDMPVLLGVIQKMKPKSTAPIMAQMAPEKAKEVTVALTKQDQLPQVK